MATALCRAQVDADVAEGTRDIAQGTSAILDEDVFNQLSALIELFSGGQIVFTSASQAVSTNAKCGLIPQLIGNIRD